MSSKKTSQKQLETQTMTQIEIQRLDDSITRFYIALEQYEALLLNQDGKEPLPCTSIGGKLDITPENFEFTEDSCLFQLHLTLQAVGLMYKDNVSIAFYVEDLFRWFSLRRHQEPCKLESIAVVYLWTLLHTTDNRSLTLKDDRTERGKFMCALEERLNPINNIKANSYLDRMSDEEKANAIKEAMTKIIEIEHDLGKRWVRFIEQDEDGNVSSHDRGGESSLIEGIEHLLESVSILYPQENGTLMKEDLQEAIDFLVKQHEKTEEKE